MSQTAPISSLVLWLIVVYWTFKRTPIHVVSWLVEPIWLGWRTFERWKSRGPYNTACIHRTLSLFFYLRRRRCRQLTMHVYDHTASIAMNMIQSNKMPTGWRCTTRRSYGQKECCSTVVGHMKLPYVLTSFSGCIIPSSTWLIVV